jgi:copper chaperone CopZ
MIPSISNYIVMKNLFIAVLMFLGIGVKAQINSASLQASGLTCSMCSKAVKNALEEVSFVKKVQVDIKSQQYNLSFKENSTVDLDALNKAVQDAGFSVASLKVTASMAGKTLQKDEHVTIGNQAFHFLNAANQTVDGPITFSVVDKSFVTAKEFKKFAVMTKLPCVQTGRMAKCCSENEAAKDSRIYHVVI